MVILWFDGILDLVDCEGFFASEISRNLLLFYTGYFHPLFFFRVMLLELKSECSHLARLLSDLVARVSFGGSTSVSMLSLESSFKTD